MDTTKPLVNKVAQKALVTLDLETFVPKEEEIACIDLKEYLFKGLILREADFREMVKNTDWGYYKDKYVVLHCSADAVIPMWAYMVLSAELAAYAKDVAFARPEKAVETFLLQYISRMDMAPYTGQRVVVKGCGDKRIQEAVYVQIVKQLAGVARVVMYGEPCSTVPVFKKLTDKA